MTNAAKQTNPDEASEAKTGQWGVIDKNAVDAPRVHNVKGTNYSLTAQNPTYMEPSHAMAFLRDEAFTVIKDNGSEVTSLPESAVQRAGSVGLKLKTGETIAKFAELKQDSLLARANALPGEEKYTKGTKVAELIAALTKAAEKAATGGTNDEGAIEGTETLGAKELEAMLSGG